LFEKTLIQAIPIRVVVLSLQHYNALNESGKN
jgi:hypothetical protein